MSSFLKSLAEYSIQNFGEKKLEGMSYIFPNRRSGIFFKNYLMQAGNGTFWMPEILTISEFISKFSNLERADPIDVSFELYRIYRELSKSQETYDEFYYWGEMMIKDFDDMDKYMVPAEKLFANIVDLKEIDHFFGGFDEDQLEVIREFWMHFQITDFSDEQVKFLDTWKILFPLYTELRKDLKNKGSGYEGMQYREVAELIMNKDFPVIMREKIIIAGFNALNKAEKVLFKYFRDSGKGLFFWDYDEEYIADEYAEAGRFIRRNLEEFPPPELNWSFDLLKNKKDIKIIELPSDILQARQLGRLLSAGSDMISSDFDSTAVILADENLLEPVISSLPASIPHINITMGYPLNHTAAYSFTDHLLRLQKNLSGQLKSSTARLYYRDVLSVLNHQYLRYNMESEIGDMIDTINIHNLIYIDPDFFENNSLLSNIFRKVQNASEMSAYLRDILEHIISLSDSGGNSGIDNKLEREYVYFIITRINKLEEVFSRDTEDKGIETYARLFRKILSTAKIPFEGEPLQGLQIMGILESRLLDFKNIIFLSMNEGIMPRSQGSYSFIPVNLRHAFKLPVMADHDAIYAYYFYRLLQRAESISILYNSKADGLKTGEKSRYLYQLEYLSSTKPQFKTLAFHISSISPKDIHIEKTMNVLRKLESYTGKGNRYLSPTAITSWLDCRLRFYFTYIAGLREQDEVVEEVDAPLLGNILHHAMKLMYQNSVDSSLALDLFHPLMQDNFIDQCINQAFIIEFSHHKSVGNRKFIPEGRNIIVYEVIKKLIKHILAFDSKQLPFKVLETEQKHEMLISSGDREVRVAGVIDRIDIRSGIKHVIDYKTGSVKQDFYSIEELFDPDAKDRRKEILQTFLYSLLCDNSPSDSTKIAPCIYSTRKIHNKDYTPYIGIKNSSRGNTSLIMDYRIYKEEFISYFKQTINDIFDPEIGFTQTSEIKRCVYCPYKAICHRE